MFDNTVTVITKVVVRYRASRVESGKSGLDESGEALALKADLTESSQVVQGPG